MTVLFLVVSNVTAAERPLVVVTEAARKVHAAGFVFDGHNDLPWELRESAGGSFDKADIALGVPKFHTDIPRLRAGNVGAQFWAAYVPVETSKESRSFTMTLEQIEIIRTMVRRYPEVFEFAKTADDVRRIQKAGKIASLIGVEGGHSIEDSLDKLRHLRELGVGYMTLTHSDTLSWADSATDEAKHNGLTRRPGNNSCSDHFFAFVRTSNRRSSAQRARRRLGSDETKWRRSYGQFLLWLHPPRIRKASSQHVPSQPRSAREVS